MNRIRAEELKGYSTIAGTRDETNPALIRVTRIVEKPAVGIARRTLRVDGLGDDEFLGWFGMHALAPTIYDVLAEMIANDLRHNGEIQLTAAQDTLRECEGYFALEMQDSKRSDFGTLADFVQSVREFALS